MAKRTKQPRAAFDPTSKKEPLSPLAGDTRKLPRAPLAVDTGKMTPAWRVGRLEVAEPYGFHKADEKQIKKVLEALKHCEGTTWDDILVRNKKHNHAVQCTGLSRPAKKRLKELKLDVEEMVSLGQGLGGKLRLWGIREQNVLHLVWFDPEHAVCPSKKKNT